MAKIVILDYGIYSHKAGFSTVYNKMPVKYTCLSMMIADLKKIGVSNDDIIIVACDGRNNWRKQYSLEYKSGRKQKLDDSGLDWAKIWEELNDLLDDIEIDTSWHVVKCDRLECDDIMAVASRYYKDREVILVTYDADMEQLWLYPNIKIWSQHKKAKRYKIKPDNFNPYELIAKKIQKEVADGLISPILSEEDYKNRKMLVDLLELPEFVEQPILSELKKIDETKVGQGVGVFSQKTWELIQSIYEPHKIITYEQQIAKAKEKEEKIERKKNALKEKLKRKKEREKKRENNQIEALQKKIKKYEAKQERMEQNGKSNS